MGRALGWSRLLLWGCESGHRGVLPSAGRGRRARSSPGAWVRGRTQGGCCSDAVSVGGLGDGDWKAPKEFLLAAQTWRSCKMHFEGSGLSLHKKLPAGG